MVSDSNRTQVTKPQKASKKSHSLRAGVLEIKHPTYKSCSIFHVVTDLSDFVTVREGKKSPLKIAGVEAGAPLLFAYFTITTSEISISKGR